MTTPQTERELLPCPFCGSPAEWGHHDCSNGEHHRCTGCGVEMQGDAANWNRRTLTRPAAPDADEVTHCRIAVAPATFFDPGVKLSTVLASIRRRAGQDGAPFEFNLAGAEKSGYAAPDAVRGLVETVEVNGSDDPVDMFLVEAMVHENTRAIDKFMPDLRDGNRAVSVSLTVNGHGAPFVAVLRGFFKRMQDGFTESVRDEAKRIVSAAGLSKIEDALSEAEWKIGQAIESALAAPAVDGGEFACCGGNDETPKSHCMDCPVKPGAPATPPADAEAISIDGLARDRHDDWKQLAKLTRQYGIRYNTNAGMVCFLRAIAQALRERPAQVEAVAWRENVLTDDECEWLNYAISHMQDEPGLEPEDARCAEVLQTLLDRTHSLYTAPPPAVDVAAWKLLTEAFEFGQFADDFDYPLTLPLRAAIRSILAQQPGVSK